MLGAGEFETEGTFSLSFARLFLRGLKRNSAQMSGKLGSAVVNFEKIVREEPGGFQH